MRNLVVRFIERFTWVAGLLLENVLIFIGCAKIAEECVQDCAYDYVLYGALVVCAIRFIKKCCE